MTVRDTNRNLQRLSIPAHCIWWDDNTGQLAFSNLEELAQLNDRVMNRRDLTTHYVDVPLLTAQFAFFEFVSDLFVWVLQEANKKANQPYVPNLKKPAVLQPPPLYL